MSRIKLSILAIVLLLVVGVPLSHFMWGVWAEHRLDQTLAELHAAGEPVTPEQLKLDSVPDSQNASLDYQAAADSIDAGTPQWKKIEESLNREYQPPLTDAEQATVHAIVLQNAPALARVVAARGKTAGAWDAAGTAVSLVPLPNLSSTRRLCSLLRFSAMDAHARGDDQQAVECLSDMLKEADAAEHRPTLVGHLVAVGCTALASETIGRMASQFRIGTNGLTHEQVAHLLSQLRDDRGMREGAKLSWRSERLFGLSFLRGAATGLWPSFGPATGTQPNQPGLERFGYFVKPIVLGDARLYARYLQDVMTAATAPDWPAAQQRMPTHLMAEADAHPYIHLFLRIILPALDKAAKVDYHAAAERRLATVALAVRLYAADHQDALPASLDDLVPAYLPAIPIDPMSGSPLRYKSDPPRVYSVGDDGVDDGGVPVDPDGDRRHREHGDIVVYLVTQPRK